MSRGAGASEHQVSGLYWASCIEVICWLVCGPSLRGGSIGSEEAGRKSAELPNEAKNIRQMLEFGKVSGARPPGAKRDRPSPGDATRKACRAPFAHCAASGFATAAAEADQENTKRSQIHQANAGVRENRRHFTTALAEHPALNRPSRDISRRRGIGVRGRRRAGHIVSKKEREEGLAKVPKQSH